MDPWWSPQNLCLKEVVLTVCHHYLSLLFGLLESHHQQYSIPNRRPLTKIQTKALSDKCKVDSSIPHCTFVGPGRCPMQWPWFHHHSPGNRTHHPITTKAHVSGLGWSGQWETLVVQSGASILEPHAHWLAAFPTLHCGAIRLGVSFAGLGCVLLTWTMHIPESHIG